MTRLMLFLAIMLVAVLATWLLKGQGNLKPLMWLTRSLFWSPRNLVPCANAGPAVGTHEEADTRLADATWATRFLLVIIGTDEDHVNLCGTGGIPLGACYDAPDTIGQEVGVQFLGATDDTMNGIASGAIAAGDFLVPGALGTVRTLPTAGGTYYIVGRSPRAYLDGDKVEYDPCLPTQRVV